MVKSHAFTCTLVLLYAFTIFLSSITCLKIAQAENTQLIVGSLPTYSSIIEEINLTNIERHFISLSNDIDSRVPGYPGSYTAIQYIADELRKNGIDVYLENFTLAVPLTYEAKLTLLSPTNFEIQAYPLWPNMIETCEISDEGLSGNIVYVEHGELRDFNGKDVYGNIVLMDFNSGRNWMNALMLGAKAIVFIEPEDTTAYEATQKILDIPLDIPRLFIKKTDGELLKNLLENGHIEVKINLKMRYENKETSNIIGVIEGTDPILKDEVIVVSAHYDTISVVPSLAPGADETWGIAALMELARVFKQFQPKRTMMFVAFSSHNLALQGAREFVDKHFDEIGSKIKLLLNIDLSAERDELVALWVGQFYQYDLDPGRFTWISQKIFNVYLPELYQESNKYSGKVFNAMDVSSWRNYIPYSFALDSEPFTVSGGLGFSFLTAKAFRGRWSTPLDVLDSFRIENIGTQAEVILWVLNKLANEEEQLPVFQAYRFNARGGGFPVLRGRVVKYNFEKGWYDPVPNALIFLEGNPKTLIYNHRIVLISNENGEFEFKGCLQSVVLGGGIYTTRYYTMWAFIDNPSSGPIEYATDFGKYGAPMYPGKIIIDKADNFATIAVFECGSVALFNCLDPFSLTPFLPAFQVMELETYAVPDQWGAISDKDVALIFVPVNLSFQIAVSKFGDTQPIALLKNCSYYSEVNGNGYKVMSVGDCLNLYHTPMLFLEDGMYQLVSNRLNISRTAELRPINIEKTQIKVTEHLFAAKDALKNKQYDVFYQEIFSAWSLEVQAYREIKNLMQDAINTIVFIFALLIPFSFLAGRLFFNFAEGHKQLIAASFIFAVFIGVLYVFHPGFLLASNIYMTLVGLIVVILLSPTLAIVVGETVKYFGEFRRRYIGKHFTSISRLGALTTSLSMGISYMKRRKLRTSLTLAAITLITFSLISFASITSFSIVKAREKSGVTLYNGVLIRTPSWSPLSENLLQFVKAQQEGKAIVCPRAWLYKDSRLITQNNSESTVSSILGVSPQENQLTKLDMVLADGSWFAEDSRMACIISNRTHVILGVNVNDTLIWNGLNLTIIGIINDKEMRSKIDLDQESIMPLSPLQPGIEKNVHSLPEEVLIVPYSLAKYFGAQIYSIAIMPINSSEIYEISSDFANTLTEVNIYSGVDGRIFFYIKGVGYEFYGWELLLVPLIIAAFIIVNSMLSSVYERAKEIAIYSSIGLSPTHIAGLFISESVVYAVISSVLGYSLGIASYPVLVNFGALPRDIPLNYSSSWVIITLGVCMLVTLLSAIYPMYRASKLVTPSIERAWKIPTKPRGDEWIIPMPFIAANEKESFGILAYLNEFFESHAVERTDAVFAASEMTFHEENASKILALKVRLSPFEMGVVQEVQIRAVVPEGEERYHFEIFLRRIDGYFRIWKMTNQKFADEIRKQLLIWRGLRQEDKEEYMKKASELIKNKREEK